MTIRPHQHHVSGCGEWIAVYTVSNSFPSSSFLARILPARGEFLSRNHTAKNTRFASARFTEKVRDTTTTSTGSARHSIDFLLHALAAERERERSDTGCVSASVIRVSLAKLPYLLSRLLNRRVKRTKSVSRVEGTFDIAVFSCNKYRRNTRRGFPIKARDQIRRTLCALVNCFIDLASASSDVKHKATVLQWRKTRVANDRDRELREHERRIPSLVNDSLQLFQVLDLAV